MNFFLGNELNQIGKSRIFRLNDIFHIFSSTINKYQQFYVNVHTIFIQKCFKIFFYEFERY